MAIKSEKFDILPEQAALARIAEAAFSGDHVLNLSELKITSLPREIGKLINLTVLNLSYNELTTLPAEIGQLTNLTQLAIIENKLTVLPPEIGQLNNLIWLNLSRNELINLPVEIGQLINLIFFNISNNRFTVLPKEINKLAKLIEINLTSNQLTTLPTEILQLTNLLSLNLSNNQLINLPREIKNLTSLTSLNLSKNRLTNLPVELRNLQKLQNLDLRENLLPIPPEILSNVNDPLSIIAYLEPLDVYEEDATLTKKYHEGRSLNEVKILILGQGNVGKTSLVRRLIRSEFDSNEPKTEGIAISRWQVENKLKTENQQPTIYLNIWDFGGQEIMHATHQFFLTKRSLYLLVLDARLTQEENRVEYWLKIIQSFGGTSPVLIVGNKTDQHSLDIDRTGLQKKYPFIVSILETSASTGDGISQLTGALVEQVNNLPHIRDLLSEAWFAVKNKLEGLGLEFNFISYDKYIEICIENEICDDIGQHTLIGFLNDLGVVLHFQDDPHLESLGILNPKWVTNGVYKILNSHVLFNNKGILQRAMLDEILNLPEYPSNKRLFIVDIMRKFELCYDIESDKTFLVPDLLPKDEPQLKFTGIPAFEYAYPVLPSSVITRFIVRMNQKIDDGLVWRTGVVLKIGANKALVKADIEDRKIIIAIGGLDHTRRDALSAIRFQLDEIHGSIKGLNPEKFVPVPGTVNAKPLPYNYLLMLEAKGIEILPVQDGNRLVEVNVRKILSGIESEAQRREHGGNITNIYIGGGIGGSLVVGNENQLIQDSFNKIKSADIQPELKEALKQLAEAVVVMTKALPKDQSAEVAEDLGKLVDEATKPKPNKKWYSVSIDGLIKAAENLDKLGEPVINLSKKVLSLLTGGVIK